MSCSAFIGHLQGTDMHFSNLVEIALRGIERHRFVLNAACAELLSTAASNCKDIRREHIQLLQDRELCG